MYGYVIISINSTYSNSKQIVTCIFMNYIKLWLEH